MTIGRNEPCPCGSGKKYKKCCMGKLSSDPGSEIMQEVLDEIGQKLESGQFASLEEAQAALDHYMGRKNETPLADFHGLSVEQMYRLLNHPFDSPELARFARTVDPPLDIPVLRLFVLLVDAIGDKGLQATAKGNLPRKFCRDAALAYWGEEKYAERSRYGDILSEMDFFEMHCVRLVAELAGLLRKYKGRFILSRKCRDTIASQGGGAVYVELLQAYITKFNWAYRDGYPEIDFIQRSFLFTLYLLHRYGGRKRLHTFYGDIFIKAFAHLLSEVPERSYMSAEDTVRQAYLYRTLEHFASFFGLIECVSISDDILNQQYEVTKLPLLDRVIFLTV